MLTLKSYLHALAGVAQGIQCQPANQKVAHSIPGQGTWLGCGQGPQLGACERQPINVSVTHRCFSLSLSLPPPLSLKINKENLEDEIFFFFKKLLTVVRTRIIVSICHRLEGAYLRK